MKKYLFPCIALSLFLAACWFAACQKDTTSNQTTTSAEVTERTNGNAYVFPATAHPYGKSYAEWSVEWLKEFLPFDCTHNPWLNPQYILYYQTGPVYFMAGISQVGGSANVTIPQGKAVLFPLINYINDFPCPDPDFHPGPNQTMQEFLTQGAVDALTGVTNLEVTVDGTSVSNLQNYFFVTNLFTFTGSADLGTVCGFDPCITGSPQVGVGTGYYVMLKPLSVGQHTVHYHMYHSVWGVTQDATFNITVQ